MSLLRTRIRLIRETRKLYRDHRDSVYVYAVTTGRYDDVDLDAIESAQAQAIEDIIEATTLDNIG